MAEEPQETLDLNAQVEYLRGLAQIVADEGLSKLEIELDDFKMTLKAASVATFAPSVQVVASSQAAPIAMTSPTPRATKNEEPQTPVVSPMVGVFYRAPSPADPNFIEVGDRVERGQTIGLVEAMKVFNEITAESAGIVAKISVETGELVETGQTLFLLK